MQYARMGEHKPLTKRYIALNYIRPIIDYVRKHGRQIEPYLAVLNIQQADLSNANLLIDRDGFPRALDLAESEFCDPNIGISIGQTMQIQHVGVLGMLIMQCSHAAEVMELQTRFQTLTGNSLISEYQRHGDELVMCLKKAAGVTQYQRHACEYNLAGWLHLKEMLLGSDEQANWVELPYPKPEDDTAQQALFRAPIRYDATTLRIGFDAAYAELPLMAQDAQLKAVLEQQATQRLRELQGSQADSDPEIARIKQMITDRLPHGPPPIEDIAESSKVSVRKLQRMLQSQNINFKQIVDQLRCELAKTYMANPQMSLVDVALMLGFAEQSSFTRAFRRWYGISPGEYRRQC